MLLAGSYAVNKNQIQIHFQASHADEFDGDAIRNGAGETTNYILLWNFSFSLPCSIEVHTQNELRQRKLCIKCLENIVTIPWHHHLLHSFRDTPFPNHDSTALQTSVFAVISQINTLYAISCFFCRTHFGLESVTKSGCIGATYTICTHTFRMDTIELRNKWNLALLTARYRHHTATCKCSQNVVIQFRYIISWIFLRSDSEALSVNWICVVFVLVICKDTRKND